MSRVAQRLNVSIKNDAFQTSSGAPLRQPQQGHERQVESAKRIVLLVCVGKKNCSGKQAQLLYCCYSRYFERRQRCSKGDNYLIKTLGNIDIKEKALKTFKNFTF
ncbi:hypothetical protein CEXT_667681 [Caerostris extrusa]|uniref:Uncharacterized protein n=1 Tax=Caerostris extrusa TaxID=172846 RepID=A0AAV4UF39_CAEEX|nr:hypothetical protein CEXT_667681 [Caerostris extrusa]